MKRGILGTMLVAAALMAGTLTASTKGTAGAPQTGASLESSLRNQILTYSNYTLWDAVAFRVDQGNVELSGAVTQPFKKADLEAIVRRTPGVVSVTDKIEVLPLSSFDDRLRLQVARAIYSDPILSRYAMGAVPAIHIIVDNGRVTLTGSVGSAMEKQLAGTRASGAGLSFGPVINHLAVELPPAKKS